MRAKDFRYGLDGKRFRARHRLEERGQPAGVEAGRIQGADADPVGFVLVRAGEIDLLLLGQARAGHQGALHEVASAAHQSTHQQCGEHRGHGHDRGSAHGLNLPRNVVLGHMGDLMRQHAGQFAFGGGRVNQARVYADVAPRQRECVDGLGLDDEKVELVVAVLRPVGQPPAQVGYVLVDFRVGHESAGAAELLDDAQRDLPLLLARQHRVGCAAHVGQFRTALHLRARRQGLSSQRQHERCRRGTFCL